MDTGRGSLLLVGDGRIAEAVEDRLRERLSVDVDTASTLDTARERVVADSVVAVVSNFDVPDADGIEHLLEHVRSQEGDLPVVLVSTSGNEDLVAEAMARDVTDYVLLDGFDDRATERLVWRIEYAVEKRLAELRADEQAHVVDVIRDVTDGLVRAETREAVEATLVDRLTDARSYSGACVIDGDGVSASAGAVGDEDAAPTLLGESVDSVTVRTRDDGESVTDALDRAGVRSALLAPIVYDGTNYGSLVVFSDRPEIRGTARSVLGELAETAGYAVDAVETRAELERQNERLDQFASLISHDLRNPLNVVSGRVDLLSADDEHLDAIRRSVDRMERIIDDMLSLAREGQVETDLESLSLSTTAADVWAGFDADDAALEVASDRELRADYGAFCELLENLYRNALEHAADDGLWVTVGALPDGFFVADDGPGVPEAEREQIFEYGYTTDPEGTGYGLPIVEQIADAHGWSATVTDAAAADGGGARFEFSGVE